MTGEAAPPMPSRVSAWSVYDVFDARRRRAALHRRRERQAVPVTLCGVLDRPDLAAEPGLRTNAQRVAVRPALLRRLGDTLAITPQATSWRRSSRPPGCRTRRSSGRTSCCTTRTSRRAAAWSPMTTDDGGTTEVVLLPLLMGGRRPGVRQPLARVGEHTDEVLAACRPRQPISRRVRSRQCEDTKRWTHELPPPRRRRRWRRRRGTPRRFATPAHAQAPVTDKPLHAILPVGAGSGVDTIVRSVAPSLSKALGGQPVVIENLPGAGGITGTQAIVKARAGRQHDRRRVEQPRDQPERLQEAAVRRSTTSRRSWSSGRRRWCWSSIRASCR